jgi:DHA1 family tetracycline resistance protein-like MFS transporter
MTAIGIHTANLSLLWAGRALAGLFAGNLTLSLAVASDASKDSTERRRYFGYMGVGAGLSFILAIIVGSTLSGPLSEFSFRPDLPFFLAALFALTAWVAIYFFYEEREHAPDQDFFRNGLRNLVSAIKNPIARPVYFAFFLFMLAWSTSLQFLSAYLIKTFGASHTTITITFIGLGLAWALANFAINPILSRYLRAQKIFLIGAFGLSLALFASLIPQPPALFLIHFIAASFFAGLAWTNSFASISLSSTATHQGSRLGFAQAIGAAAMAIGPIFGGLILGVDIRILYISNAVAALVAGLFLLKKIFLSFRPFFFRKEECNHLF